MESSKGGRMEARRSWAGHSEARLDVGGRSRKGSGGHSSKLAEAELVQDGGPSAKLAEAEIVGGPSSRLTEAEIVGGPLAKFPEAIIVGGPSILERLVHPWALVSLLRPLALVEISSSLIP